MATSFRNFKIKNMKNADQSEKLGEQLSVIYFR